MIMKRVVAMCLLLCMVCFVVTFAAAWDDKETTVKGWISDDKCGTKGANAGAEACTKKCLAAGAKMVVPSRDTCEHQAALFAGNEPRLQGQREWPALLRLADKLDPSYRN